MRKNIFFLVFLIFILEGCEYSLMAQKSDKSLNVKYPLTTLMPPVKQKKPSTAAILSAIFPGAGQMYNGSYWHVPIVWLFVGYNAYNLYYNVKWYNESAFAMEAIRKATNDLDSFDYYHKMNPIFKNFNYDGVKRYKDRFVYDINESIFWLTIMWTLNIVDAAVDAHLRNFDVSNHLSLKIKPNCDIENINNQWSYKVGIGAIFNIHSKRKKSRLKYCVLR